MAYAIVKFYLFCQTENRKAVISRLESNIAFYIIAEKLFYKVKQMQILSGKER